MPARTGSSDIIEKRQNEQPDDIYKVPIECNIGQTDMVAGRETAIKELTQEAPEDEQNADGDMDAVESGNDEKARTIDAARVEPEAFMMQVEPFVALHTDEERTKRDRHKKPT